MKMRRLWHLEHVVRHIRNHTLVRPLHKETPATFRSDQCHDHSRLSSVCDFGFSRWSSNSFACQSFYWWRAVSKGLLLFDTSWWEIPCPMTSQRQECKTTQVMWKGWWELHWAMQMAGSMADGQDVCLNAFNKPFCHLWFSNMLNHLTSHRNKVSDNQIR